MHYIIWYVIYHKLNHTVRGLLCVASVTKCNVLTVCHIVVCVSPSFFLIAEAASMLRDVPSSMYTLIVMDTGMSPLSWLLWIMVLWLLTFAFVWAYVFLSPGCVAPSVAVRCGGKSMINHLRNHCLVLHSSCTLAFPQAVHEGSDFSTSSQCLAFSFLIKASLEVVV